MALTAEEKIKIVIALGLPANTIAEGSSNFNKTVKARIEEIPVDAEPMIRSYLQTISKIELKLSESVDRAMAVKLGDIEINPMETDILRRELSKTIKTMARICDLDAYRVSGASNMGSVIL